MPNYIQTTYSYAPIRGHSWSTLGICRGGIVDIITYKNKFISIGKCIVNDFILMDNMCNSLMLNITILDFDPDYINVQFKQNTPIGLVCYDPGIDSISGLCNTRRTFNALLINYNIGRV